MKTVSFFLATLLMCGYLQAAENSFVDRAIEWLVFSRRSYQKEVDVFVYVLDREQIAELLADPCNVQPVQKTRAELVDKQQYLVFRIKNRGEYVVWGSLAFYVDNKYLAKSNVLDMWIPTIPNEYDVIPIGKSITEANDEPPKVKFRWKSVYVQ